MAESPRQAAWLLTPAVLSLRKRRRSDRTSAAWRQGSVRGPARCRLDAARVGPALLHATPKPGAGWTPSTGRLGTRLRVAPCTVNVTCFTVGVSRSAAACGAIRPARPCGTGLRVRPEQGHGAFFRVGRRLGHVAAFAIVHWQTGRAAHGLDDACAGPALREATHGYRLCRSCGARERPFGTSLAFFRSSPARRGGSGSGSLAAIRQGGP